MLWSNLANPDPRRFICGFCGNMVASVQDWYTNVQPQSFAYVCPNCDCPTFFSNRGQIPGVVPGNEVSQRGIQGSNRVKAVRLTYEDYGGLELGSDVKSALSFKRKEFQHEREIRFLLDFNGDEIDE